MDLQKNQETADRAANGAVNGKSPSSTGAPGLPEPKVFFPGQSISPNINNPREYLFMPLNEETSSNMYAKMNTFDVPSADTRRPPEPTHRSQEAATFFEVPSADTQRPPQPTHRFQEAATFQGTRDNVSTFKGPSGLFPGGWKVDIPASDEAYQAPTPPSNNTPSGLTPAESQNASSATSYSPRQDEGRKSASAEEATQMPHVFSLPTSNTAPNLSHQTTNSSGMDDSSSSSYNMPSNQTSISDAFNVPSGWDFSAGNMPLPTGNTPLPSGMSPPANGDWSQLLGSMTWSATGTEHGGQNWEGNGNAGASPRYGYKSGFLYEAGDDQDPNRMGK